MSNIKYLIKIGEKAKIASTQLSQLDNKEKNKVLSDFLKCIKSNRSKILKANKVNENLQYNGIDEWDSIAHMTLMAAIAEEYKNSRVLVS